MRKVLISFSALIAVALAGMLIYQNAFYSPKATKTKPLKELIISELPGWTSREVPLAQSKEMQARVESILNFNDAFFKVYKKGNTEVSVYVAYWLPHQMPIRLVQAHTPEVCWVRAGWSVVDTKSNVLLEIDGEHFKPAEYRLMSHSPIQQHVYYWHVIGDRVHTAKAGAGQWDRWDPIKSLFKFGLAQQNEQYFIRVSSNKDFGTLWQDDQFRALMKNIGDIAAFKPQT